MNLFQIKAKPKSTRTFDNDNDNDNSLLSISGLRPIIQITFYYIIIISSTHDSFSNNFYFLHITQ